MTPEVLPPAPRHPAGDPSGGGVLVLPAVVEPEAVTVLCRRLEAILNDPDVTGATVDTGALGRPDIAAVDALARLQLTARRRGHELSLVHMSPALQALLELTGLSDAVGEPEPR